MKDQKTIKMQEAKTQASLYEGKEPYTDDAEKPSPMPPESKPPSSAELDAAPMAQADDAAQQSSELVFPQPQDVSPVEGEATNKKQPGRVRRYLQERLRLWRRGIQHYPLTLLASTVMFVLMVYLVESNASGDPSTHWVIRMSASVALAAVAGISFMWIGRARWKEENKALVFTGVFMVLLAGGAMVYLSDGWGFVKANIYAGSMLLFILLYLALPFRLEKGRVEQNLIDTADAFFQGALFAFVFFVGVSAVLATVRYLFDLEFITWKYFVYTFYLAVFVLGMFIFLSELFITEEGIEIRPYGRVIKTLLIWIILPIFAVYTSILYAYFVRILLLRTWPRGMVSHMVLWYSALSVFLLLFLNPLRKGHKTVHYFCKFFPWIVLPVMGMMFASMGIRIRQYGITESRYYVLALGVWVVFAMIWYGMFRGEKNAGIFAGLCLIILISIGSPLSSFALSKNSQNQLFNEILEENNMLVNGKVTAGKELDSQDQKRLKEILRYFRQNHSFKDVKALPEGFTETNSEEVLGFALNFNEYGYQEAETRYINVYMDTVYEGAVDIQGYRTFCRHSLFYPTIHAVGEYQIQSREDRFLSIKNATAEISLDLQALTLKLAEKQRDAKVESKEIKVPLEDGVLEGEENGIAWKIVVSNLHGEISPTDWKLKHFDFILFLK